MKKALLVTFCIAALFVLIVLMFPFKENPVIEETTVSVQQEIVYAYVTTEMLTNGYGGVYGHQDYICYGVHDGDNILDKMVNTTACTARWIVDIFSMVNGAGSLRVELAQKSSNGQNCRSPNPRR